MDSPTRILFLLENEDGYPRKDFKKNLLKDIDFISELTKVFNAYKNCLLDFREEIQKFLESKVTSESDLKDGRNNSESYEPKQNIEIMPYTKTEVLANLFLEESEFDKIIELLHYKKNIIIV